MSRSYRPTAIALGLVGVAGAVAGCSAPAAPVDPADRRYTDGTYVAEGPLHRAERPRRDHCVDHRGRRCRVMGARGTRYLRGRPLRFPGPVRQGSARPRPRARTSTRCRSPASRVVAHQRRLQRRRSTRSRPRPSSLIDDPLPRLDASTRSAAPWRIDTARPLADAARRGRRAHRAVRPRLVAVPRRLARRPDRPRSRAGTDCPTTPAPLLSSTASSTTRPAGRVSPLVGRALEALGYDAALPPDARQPTRGRSPRWDGCDRLGRRVPRDRDARCSSMSERQARATSSTW